MSGLVKLSRICLMGYHSAIEKIDKTGRIMENEKTNGEYQANDADALVGELFSGGITVGEAIERLRTRLLDLSARNRLLNYRHPKGRCIQIADEPNVNLVFNRLYVDGKGVPFKYVPEPSPDTYEGKRPEAKLYAARVGISTSFEFAPNPAGSSGHRLHGIQTLLYPADLERQLRKIASEARSVRFWPSLVGVPARSPSPVGRRDDSQDGSTGLGTRTQRRRRRRRGSRVLRIHGAARSGCRIEDPDHP